ncbi:O-acetyl-ADP-ribose deacetylase [Euphorbia peplus]|nr:O-acetyl-ADP-ribose deacetylase [Euphorbia peplus]
MPVDISAGVLAGQLIDHVGITHVFPLSSSSLLKVNKGDITSWFINGRSDAIVNPTNVLMHPGGGADLAIHRASGQQLREMCYSFPQVRPGVRCPVGEARITPAFKLQASHVIHTVGPIYFADSNPVTSLRNAYRSCLTLAKANNMQYVAFPAISCGIHGYPLEEAAAVAISTVKEFADDFKEVHFVLFLEEVFNVWLEKTSELLLD